MVISAEAHDSPILNINNIEVKYHEVILVLKGVSMLVPAGGVTALLGANGAGKTTTLQAVSGLLKYDIFPAWRRSAARRPVFAAAASNR